MRALTGILAGVALVVVASAPLRESTQDRVVAFAHAVLTGRVEPADWDGRDIPYSWGGGHAKAPGPSTGTCRGYRGSIRPCPAERTRGLDCSGLTRWVYHLAHGRDVLGPGNTNDHLARLRRVPADEAVPGDLVFYGQVTPRRRTHHVGVYIGGGRMINALKTGTVVRVDPITAVKGLAGFYRYDRPARRPAAR
ncbi:C40 family peptidase [Bailinhaonella thermotolerans]|uniref:Peptidoglycan endopeptidase n=1 Tax=Bailinhaonella thermotolerans TaxID=1070861 RepID=A0A3A4AZ95_9ACTN|nr:NlpC/P60 family protein [Bailinhaonella thermotolerans]RJL30540.1 peptidoglycan endopeptidase [Bailinhaonella thermotolerans]